MRRVRLLLAGFVSVACDDGGGAAGASEVGPGDGVATDAETTDGGPPDAAPPDVECPEVRFASARFAVRNCPDSQGIVLAVGPAAPPFARLRVEGRGPGQPLTVARLPGVAWRTTADGVDVRWAGEDGPTPLAGETDTDASLGLTITLSDDGRGLLLRARMSWPGAARFPGPYRPTLRLEPVSEAPPEEAPEGPQPFFTTGDGVLLLTPDPDTAPALRVRADTLAAEAAPAEAPGIAPGTTWRLPPVELDLASTRQEAQARWAARHGAPRGPQVRWGWRSGPALGGAISAQALNEVAASLPYVPELPPPVLLAEGRWFDRYGADSPSPGFPAGVIGAVAVTRAAGAELALRWTPLATSTDTTCAECGLDPRDPDVRAGAARRAGNLFQAGVLGLAVDLPPADEGGFHVPASFVAALRQAGGADHTLHFALPADSLTFAAADVVETTPEGAPADPPCGRVAQASLDPACGEALRTLERLEDWPRPSVSGPGEDDRARMLVRSWPLSAAGQLLCDGGFATLGLDDAAARRLAALSALGGGLYLLHDLPMHLTPARLELLVAPLRRGLLRWPAARPRWLHAPPEDPPDLWHRPGHALALFHRPDSPKSSPSVAELAPDLARRNLVDAFTGEAIDAAAPLTVAPGDVRVVVARRPAME